MSGRLFGYFTCLILHKTLDKTIMTNIRDFKDGGWKSMPARYYFFFFSELLE